jgi:hypothetical protein
MSADVVELEVVYAGWLPAPETADKATSFEIAVNEIVAGLHPEMPAFLDGTPEREIPDPVT